MNKLIHTIPQGVAYYGLILISVVALIYHFLIITMILDYRYAWGGRLQSDEQMYQFEAVSIIIQLILLIVVLSSRWLAQRAKGKYFYRIFFVVMALLFVVNTAGNVFAVEPFERYLFTPLTLIACFLSLRLALDHET